MPYDVGVAVLFVPPFAIGSTPLTWVVRPILPHAGAIPTPPEMSALPVATSGSFPNVVVVSAYSKSPTAYVAYPVPPFFANSVPDRTTSPIAPVTGARPVEPPDQLRTPAFDTVIQEYRFPRPHQPELPYPLHRPPKEPHSRMLRSKSGLGSSGTARCAQCTKMPQATSQCKMTRIYC